MSDSSSAALHPLAPHHIPGFLPDATGGDPLTTFVGALLLVLLLGIGTVYFRLHSLPEQMAHGTARLQVVSILALLALLTHNNTLWVIALLLAAVQIPDFHTPLQSIAASLKKANKQKAGS